MNEISKETFEEMDEHSKLNVLYDVMRAQPSYCADRAEKCDARFTVNEKSVRKWGVVHATLVPPFSFLGGFFAMLLAKSKMFGG